VRIANLDDGFLGRLLLEALGEQGLRPVPPDHDQAKRGITVPATPAGVPANSWCGARKRMSIATAGWT